MNKFFFLFVVIAIFASAVFALDPQPSSEEVENSEDMGAAFQSLIDENPRLKELFELMEKEPENEAYLNEFFQILTKGNFGFEEKVDEKVKKADEKAQKIDTESNGTDRLGQDL